MYEKGNARNGKKNLNLFIKKNKKTNKIKAKDRSLSSKTSLTTNFLNNSDMKTKLENRNCMSNINHIKFN